ncbi:MAG: Hsp70 family protein, partial [Symbiobacteriaceae bacterium]|nr:Hsp70 family protein [Symbiobacteriaceae bacterium]
MSKKVYGIDLGTTYSAISTLDDRGMPEMIQNFFDSEDLLASVVYFPEVGDPVVGKEAKNQAEISPQDVVQYIKREIGKEHAQTRIFGGQPYDAISISALILKRLKEYAEDQGHEVRDVVITCPAYFGNEERDATRQAGTIAGLNVLNIVNEPTAAALNYCCREYQENRKIMVYDLGGGTFDVTLFDFAVDENGKASIVVLGTGGDDQLGGIDWDNRLYNQICKLYADENGIDTNSFSAELRQKLRAVVEETKRSLTGLQSRSFTINHAGDSTRLEVTRQGFEELTHDLVARTISFVHKLLGEAAVAPEAVDVVLLVG